MADNTLLNAPFSIGDTIATEDIAGVKYELIKLMFGSTGVATKVDAANPLPVTDANTQSLLAALGVILTSIDAGTAAALGQALMAASVPVVIASDQSAVPISGTVNANTGLSQPLTDAQLRAVPVPVSGTVNANTGLSQPLTDAQLRAVPVPISGTVAVTGAGDATAANQTTQITAEQGIRAAVEIMDDWDESDRAKVNLIVGQAGIAAGTGVDGVTVPRVTLATNVPLPAGTNLLGIAQSKDLPDASATYALSNATSTAYEASRVIKASAGYLYMLTGYNSKTTAQFIMISNTTAVPADAQVPVIVFTVQAASNFSFDFGKYGRYFSTGICVFNSSTAPAKLIGSADCFFDSQYI